MYFSGALVFLRDNQRITRSGWNGKGMWIALQKPDQNSKMTLPYIYMKTADGKLVPWLASQTDILADDWQVIINHSTTENICPECRQGKCVNCTVTMLDEHDNEVPCDCSHD